MSSSTPLSPTFYGHIASTQDALVLFEACLNGQLNHVARRPHDRERASLIKSGNVFIYEEHSSGIKRWTDGVPWSPSRILGNFLVYRELERPFPPGEKKRAMKRSKRSPGISKASEPYGDLSSGMSSGYSAASTAASTFESSNSASSLNKETERSLIGSLIDSYGFKEEGLVKKTVSVTVAGISHHLVSYYTVADVMSNKFSTPTKDPRFAHTTPRSDLVTKQNFRTAIDEIDNMDRLDDRSPLYGSYPYPRNGYDMTNQNISQRTMSAPSRTSSFGHSPSLFNNGYNLNGSSGVYGDHFQSPTTTSNYASQFAPAPGIYPAPTIKSENQDGGAFRPRYNSVIGSSMDSNRSQMAPVPTNYSRRSSNFEHSGSIDSGISGVSSASVDSKVSSDSGYSSAAYYGTALRNTTNTSHAYATQRSLPTPHVATTYIERPPIHSYTMDNPSPKDNMWPIGNASAGHGHYMATQQPWASTGTS